MIQNDIFRVFAAENDNSYTINTATLSGIDTLYVTGCQTAACIWMD